MAPKREHENTNVVAAAATRFTRSYTHQANITVALPAADPQSPKSKRAKTTTTSADKQEAGGTDAKPPLSPMEEEIQDGSSKTIITEHCKQCNSFKTRAAQVKNGLEKDVVGVNVVINPEKPRKGCFEIRAKDGEIFVSLLDMKRPFAPMKALNIKKVISDIVEKIK